MKKVLVFITILLLPVIIHSKPKIKTKKMFNKKLSVNIHSTWQHKSFDFGEVKTEQFNNKDKSIIISFCLEKPGKRSFKKYLKYRYKAAKTKVWKKMKSNYKFKFNYEYDYKMYNYNYKKSKKKGHFKKFVICINGISSYLTITLVVRNKVLDKKMDLLNNLFKSIKIKK